MILCINVFLEPLLRALRLQSKDIKKLCLDILLSFANDEEICHRVSRVVKPSDFAILIKVTMDDVQSLTSITSLASKIIHKDRTIAKPLCKESLFVQNLLASLKVLAKDGSEVALLYC